MDRFSDPQDLADFLRAGGLRDVKVDSAVSTHRLAGFDELWELAMSSLARASSLIRVQTRDMQKTIRRAVAASAQEYARADGLHIPIAFLVASGQIGRRSGKPERRPTVPASQGRRGSEILRSGN